MENRNMIFFIYFVSLIHLYNQFSHLNTFKNVIGCMYLCAIGPKELKDNVDQWFLSKNRYHECWWSTLF